MTGYWLDEHIGEQVGDATRAEVLESLRGHVLGWVVIGLELPGGATLMHVQGTLLEAARDEPDTWETAETFAVDADPVYVNTYHVPRDHRDRLRAHGVAVSSRSPSAYLLQVPETGIERYTGGYRFRLPGGAALAIVIWHEVMHVTDGGDLAPGIGGFDATVQDGPS